MKFYVCPNCGALFCETETSCPGCGFNDLSVLNTRVSEFYVDNGVLRKHRIIPPSREWDLYCEIKSAYIPNVVTSIGDKAFMDCSSLSFVQIPNSVKTIEENAFAYCSSLHSIDLPNGLNMIGAKAFCSCDKLKKVVIPKECKEIGPYAFTSCTCLKEVVLSNDIKRIEEETFSFCGLTDIKISNSVEYIDTFAFACCDMLEQAEIPGSCKEIGAGAFYDCTSLKSVVLNDGVEKIGVKAFEQCTSLESIEFPDSVIQIEKYAFQLCRSLRKISVPFYIKEIGDYAFYQCSSLADVYSDGALDDWPVPIPKYPMWDPGTTWFIPDEFSNEWVAHSSGWCLGGESAWIKDGLIGRSAFEGCVSLINAVIPTRINTIEYDAFKGCVALESVNFSYDCNLFKIGSHAFDGCARLKDLHAGVDVIEDSAFKDCKLLEIIDLNYTSSIQAHAFKGCLSLKEIFIPYSDIEVDDSAFEGCPISYKDISPFTDELSKIDIANTISLNGTHCHNWNVYYDENVEEYTKIPGLIEFLDDEMDRISGFAQGIFCNRHKINLSENIPIILSPLHKTQTFGDPDELLKELISRYTNLGVKAVPTDELEDALGSVPITDTLAGAYDPETFKIYIFYRELNAVNTKDYLAHARNVLAHEVFHAIHHIYAPKTFTDNCFNAKCVKEALADFFCFMYSVDPNLLTAWSGVLSQPSLGVAEKRYLAWKNRWGTFWPYAYALCIMNADKCGRSFVDFRNNYPVQACTDRFIETFEFSKRSMTVAYSLLKD